MAFSFSFAGDDIEIDDQTPPPPPKTVAKEPISSSASTAGAFPVQGKPQLPPISHDLEQMLKRLPSKIAFSSLTVALEDGRTIQIPRRELWDVRVQLMAEDDADSKSESEAGLGQHDVKTGIYEGGFKSWESSVDLVKVLAKLSSADMLNREPCVLIELGCGTALPSLVLFQWALAERSSGPKHPLVITLADYNPTVLWLVTLPNIILAWALQQRGREPVLGEAFTPDGELELTPEVIEAFKRSLTSNQITFSFLSGAWSPEFVDMLYSSTPPASLEDHTQTLVLGSETIYSPFALERFSTTLLSILQRERRERPGGHARAVIAAKKLYFGVGGSLDDFVDRMRELGTTVETLFEEPTGVVRGVVGCQLS
ncbi:hypothetical protein QBC35DRAFT_193023 [Podospora australis]|uniref:protein-histidine N-methyltransferase n=1 Tax=Podospora australis TaxID=1536484 RepID=A0AAN6WYX1_9PEZI|nr:hypothetical protein QBC35DRAFT_193023 [Podospora australis]